MDNLWKTHCQNDDGQVLQIYSKVLILATGGEQRDDLLYTTSFGGKPLLPRYRHKVILSDKILGRFGVDLLCSRLIGCLRPKIVIIGGSHSAISCCWVCLDKLKSLFEYSPAVTLMHRSPIKLTYSTADEAWADGYHDFTVQDICSDSGRVFPLGGLRGDSRQLIRDCYTSSADHSRKNLQFFRLSKSTKHAEKLFHEADIIIPALGYHPRALRLFDQNGSSITLRTNVDVQSSLVDEHSRVIDGFAKPVPNVFAIGLSSGFPFGGRFGEPSFRGQANGVYRWQNEIGEELLAQALGV